MTSPDYGQLMRLIFSDHKRVQRIDIDGLGSDAEQTTVTFTDGTTFQSAASDVSNYALHLKTDVDSDGNMRLAAYKDLNRYYDDVLFLLDRDNAKQRAAMADLQSGQFQFSYDPDELLAKFLKSRRRNTSEFLPLKTDYFYIAAHQLLQSQHGLTQHRRAQQRSPGLEQAHDTIDRLYMRAFRPDGNFIKNFLTQHTQSRGAFDLEDFIKQVMSIVEHTDLLKITFPAQGIPTAKGIRLVLDSYRRYAEACVKPLNLLRIGKELVDGNPTPDRTKGAMQNKRILQPALGDLLDCYDPRVRNAEAHLSTEIDSRNDTVIITDGRGAKRRVLATYGFQDIIGMANQMKDVLFPGLVFTFVLEWRVLLTVVVCSSAEYKHMLLAIDNT